MNYGGQIEQDEMAKGCGTRARDEGEVQIATGTRECDRPLKTPGRNFCRIILIKFHPDATVRRYLFTCKVTLHVSGVTAPIIRIF